LGWVLVLFAGVVGVLIGMVGVGGVLLPPALIAAGGMSVNAATATSTWAFLFTGVVGTVAYAWRGVIPWRMLLHLAVGIVPAAFLGARANAVLPAAVVLLAMAVLTLFVGIHQLLHKESPGRGRELGIAHLVALGAVVGFGSALTGTGGPVMLVPALLVLGVVPLKAVAVSQAAQLPLVASGSIGYLQAGLTDISLGTLLGIVAASGTITGALIATRLSPQRLRQVVALACIAAGAFLLVRTIVAFR
jgi:uncharacterized membrane protein YfcA